MPKQKKKKTVDTIRHEDATRKNLPSAEHQPLMQEEDQSPLRVAYERRNRDLDPQLVWRGKDEQDWSDLVVNVPPLYIQERVHPKVLVDDLMHKSEQARRAQDDNIQPGFADLFADFNGLPSEDAKTEFYQHDANWSNRMVLGDSLQVMASLAEREGLRGKVQCIYIDPPYGIRFNSNFQWSTTSRDVRDGKADHITREPEQVKAFRDTWRDGIHSYLTYLRDRLTVARDLLTESGSIFVQIGDENVHLVRVLMEEVFGEENFVSLISFRTTAARGGKFTDSICDFIIWFSRDRDVTKYRQLFLKRSQETESNYDWIETETGIRTLDAREKWVPQSIVGGLKYALSDPTSQGYTPSGSFQIGFQGGLHRPPSDRHWATTESGMKVLNYANRLQLKGRRFFYRRFLNDYPVRPITNVWDDTALGGFLKGDTKLYVVQTAVRVIERCILMTTDPGDLVLDPTCGSGTTAYVAEQWGRRWITIDTSRVALALARARIMGARYPYYLLADSRDGQLKEAEIERKAPSESHRYGDIRQGFVYERVPHITLRAIANNAEIDVIWEEFQQTLEPLREDLNAALGRSWEEWEVPREAEEGWPQEVKKLHEGWWQQRIARQKEIDASIAAKADYEYLYDKPYEDRNKVRVAGPFTVESISPHRVLAVDENDEFIETFGEGQAGYSSVHDFASIILDNLRTAGVQQAHKEDRIDFTSLTPWPGHHVCAEGRFFEGSEENGTPRRAAI
ncbi:MAG: site-specific DNA-methyltransferase, partial [Caldilineaceae bacterium SB0665_bin_25]|nr:site-specific DNA-methyltransferase [Caldilineaceae bacterium SB0665_bin_25]